MCQCSNLQQDMLSAKMPIHITSLSSPGSSDLICSTSVLLGAHTALPGHLSPDQEHPVSLVHSSDNAPEGKSAAQRYIGAAAAHLVKMCYANGRALFCQHNYPSLARCGNAGVDSAVLICNTLAIPVLAVPLHLRARQS